MTTWITLVRTGLLQEVRMENDRVDQEINQTLSMSINISCPQSIRIRHAVAYGGVRVSQATTTIATSNFCLSSQLSKWLITPCVHARARGYVIGRGVHIYICKKMSDFSPYLSKYSLSDTHFNTGRLLFKFNRLQYTLAAPEVFYYHVTQSSQPTSFQPCITACILQRAIIFLTSQRGVCVL